MQKLMACLLLLCVGISIPAAATPCICLSELFGVDGSSSCAECSMCCSDCCSDEQDGPSVPCCLELEELPDAEIYSLQMVIPPASASDLDTQSPLTCFDSLRVLTLEKDQDIRGPTLNGLPRAMLAIWRL